MNLICKVCGNSANNTTYVAREMMFGFRDEFEYFQCSQCDCLQATKIPDNLKKYYPANYYSFSKPTIQKTNRVKRFIKRQRSNYSLNDKGIIGNIALKIFGRPNLPEWAKTARLNVDSTILDVGCGAGHLLLDLQKQGFSNLTGVDPYIEKDCYYKNGVRILKKDFSELNKSFEFIMLHHSFEHMWDPINTLIKLHTKLTPHGLVLIRIPIISSFAWKKYRTNWVQLDAPRHYFLHSIKSMELLAKQTGFEIESIEFDSSEFQFLGSEQYVRDISLQEKKSIVNGIDSSIFTEDQVTTYKRKAEELNKTKEGDQACFLLRKQAISPNKTNAADTKHHTSY